MVEMFSLQVCQVLKCCYCNNVNSTLLDFAGQ